MKVNGRCQVSFVKEFKTKNGKIITTCSLAISKKEKNIWRYVNVQGKCFKPGLAETIKDFDGSIVDIEGFIDVESYLNKENHKIDKVIIIINSIVPYIKKKKIDGVVDAVEDNIPLLDDPPF